MSSDDVPNRHSERIRRPVVRVAVLVCFVSSSLVVAFGPGAPSAVAEPSSVPKDMWVTNGPVRSVAVSGGDIYLGGDFTYIGPRTGAFAQLDASSATPDLDFPEVSGGKVGTAVGDGSGGWYIGGDFTHVDGQTAARLAHIAPNGTLDAGFTPLPNTGSVSALALEGSTLYVGGSFTAIGGQAQARIAALNPATGAASPTWDPDITTGGVLALAVSGTTVYAGGSFVAVDGQMRNRMAAFDAATGALKAWDPNAGATVSALAVSGTTVYAGGNFLTIGGQARARIAALDPTTGAQVPTWTATANGQVIALAVSGGFVYAGGSFSTIGGLSRSRLAKLDATTGAPASWNANVPTTSGTAVSAIVVDASTVYVGGTFSAIGGVQPLPSPRNNIAALSASDASATTWNPVAGASVSTLAVDGASVYAGGSFTSVGGQLRNRVAALDATTGAATAWNPNVAGTSVRALAVGGGSVYAGGTFTQVGGQTRNNLAAIDASTGTPTSWAPNANGTVSALLLDGSTLYVGGAFANSGGQARNLLAAFETATGSLTSWDPAATGTTVNALVLSGNALYAGGSFTAMGGQPRSNLAALSVSTAAATAWAPDPNDTVSSLAADGGTIYAGGAFSSIGGALRDRVAALDATGTPTAWTPAPDNAVTALAVAAGTVYAGGDFTSIGGQARDRIAAVASSGSATSWNPDADGGVWAIAMDGGNLYAAGGFSSIGGRASQGIAVFEGSQLPTLSVSVSGNGSVTGPGIDCPGDCVESFADGTLVGLSASPDTDAVFGGWSGACTGTGACNVTITGDQNVSATFAGPYTLAVTTNGNGTVSGVGIACPGDCVHSYAPGTSVTLNASPATDAAFDGWSGNCTGTGSCVLTMNGDRSASAAFSGPHRLDVAVSGGGSVSGAGIACPTDCAHDYSPGTVVGLTAVPDAGWAFDGWSGDCSGTPSCDVTMSADRNVIATFVARHTLDVTAAGAGSGTITGAGIDCPGDCTQDYDEGQQVTLTATAGSSSRFDAFSGDCTGTSCVLTMGSDKNVTATFVARHTLDVTAAGSGSGTITGPGIDCPGDCTQDYDEGQQVTLTATAGSSSRFDAFSGDCTGTSCVLTMNADKSVTATLIAQHSLTVTRTGTGSGSVTGPGIDCPGDCTHDYDEGSVVPLVAAPGVSSTFDSWSGACSGAACVVTMDSDKTVDASFNNGVFRPDAGVKRSTSTAFVGTDAYSTDETQLLSLKSKRGKTAIFDVALQNDGTVIDALLATGCAKSAGYGVSYFNGTTNITSQITSASGFSTASLLPQGISSIQMRVKVSRTAVKKKSCVIQVGSIASPTTRDVVKVLLKPV